MYNSYKHFPDDIKGRIIALIPKLSPRYKECMEMAFLKNMPYSEIATTLGLSENTIKTNIMKAKRILFKMDPVLTDFIKPALPNTTLPTTMIELKEDYTPTVKDNFDILRKKVVGRFQDKNGYQVSIATIAISADMSESVFRSILEPTSRAIFLEPYDLESIANKLSRFLAQLGQKPPYIDGFRKDFLALHEANLISASKILKDKSEGKS